MANDAERAFWEAHRAALITRYAGQYLVIENAEVRAFPDSESSLRYMIQRHGAGAAVLLVRAIDVDASLVARNIAHLIGILEPADHDAGLVPDVLSAFEAAYWAIPEDDGPRGDEAWDVLGELAVDAQDYQPRPELSERGLFGDEEAQWRNRKTLDVARRAGGGGRR